MQKPILAFLIFLILGCQSKPSNHAADTTPAAVNAPQLAQKTPPQPSADSLPLDTPPETITNPTPKPIPSTPPKSTPAPSHKKTVSKRQNNYPKMTSKKYITGRFNQRKHPDFVRLDDRYCAYPDMYLRKEVYAAFLKMRNAAQKDHIRLTIRSATRNFFTQKRIWENKWTGKRNLAGGENLAKTTKSPLLRAKKILRYSSMPGSSRHHWGTDIDLNDLANSYFESGKGYKMYQWMLKNAHQYGFYQVYTAKGPKRPVGYNEERWHWTYLPTSKIILRQAKKILKDEDFTGFLGSQTAPQIHIVQNYVLGINPECL